MAGCTLVGNVAGFLQPLQHLPAYDGFGTESLDIIKIISSAVGGVVVNNFASCSQGDLSDRLEAELDNRLSFPWIIPGRIHSRRIALVEGRRDHFSGRYIFESALALGIRVVVLDEPGHWLEEKDAEHSHLREGFIGLDMKADKSFPERILNALRSYGKSFDAIMTVDDRYLVSVAQVAERLRLPTSSPMAYGIATDKFKTRSCGIDQRPAIQVSGIPQLQRLLQNSPSNLSYPLVVKPCHGRGSNAVTKVFDQEQLFQAVQHACAPKEEFFTLNNNAMIEPYIDGPEVDINIVLWDGKILFSEISDDFPSAGDEKHKHSARNFLETKTVSPSGLANSEKDQILSFVHKNLLAFGFLSGVFHCEARIQHSSMVYKSRNGVLDLHRSRVISNQKPSVFLVEVNARTPGYFESVLIASTYGIDYYGLVLLRALDDEQRFRSLACPFANGPQYHHLLLLIPPEMSGVVQSNNATFAGTGRSSIPRENVLSCEALAKGEKAYGPESSQMNWIAIYSVMSRKGRNDVLQIGKALQNNIQYKLVEE